MGSKQVNSATRTTSSTPTKPPQNNASPKSTFRTAVYARLDNPLNNLFRLGIRIVQFVFSLGSGISYAIELAHGHTSPPFIYSQVVFALTMITLVIDALTLRSYRLTFIVESTICVLWLALFGVFYDIYFSGKASGMDYDGMDLERVKRAVWLNLINFLLWLASAVFSAVMCCSGIKGAIKGRLQRRRAKKLRNGKASDSWVETGVLHEEPRASREGRLPMYEEIVAATRAG
ncbi:hypothetical protein SLS60_009692 [Paraconiothyrium brasiliense]|uniref:MARVEL domain-containing protein n=1 Tax=Paraconiothyrium brasiliense TaxID=300254 RepID=A0ABR3QSL0_9PLEO